jgi:putative oxidoreductase
LWLSWGRIYTLGKKKGGDHMLKRFLYSEDRIALGLLVVRIGIGIAFVLHGFPKLFMGGAVGLSKGLAAAGIPGGVIAAELSGMAEFFGGLALIMGIFFRPATMIMAFNMLVALTFHLKRGDPFVTYSHALESGILFLSLAISGAGKYSLDRKLFGSEAKEALPSKESECSTSVPAQQPI